ncbi:MAG: hypothetical protein KDA66_20865, partial [Planctomycetaceae bacterium]|nr:hypothetical protein [Planctomycetaceae bacterium]
WNRYIGHDETNLYASTSLNRVYYAPISSTDMIRFRQKLDDQNRRIDQFFEAVRKDLSIPFANGLRPSDEYKKWLEDANLNEGIPGDTSTSKGMSGPVSSDETAGLTVAADEKADSK